MTPDPRRSNQAGFTLIEMLVALAIAVVVAAMTPRAFEGGERAWRTVVRAETMQERELMLDFLIKRIAAARPVFQTSPSGLAELVFEGSPSQLVFVADFADGPSGGGPYRVDLTVRHSETSNLSEVVATITPYPASGAGETVAHRTVIGTFRSATLRYWGRDPASGAETWLPTWPKSAGLPQLIALTLDGDPGIGTPSRTHMAALAFAQQSP